MTYRVLIVDDEERMRRVLTMVFEEMNDVKVVTTNNCVTTFDYLDKEHIHLLITDLKVPEMERLAFLRAIKNKKGTFRIGCRWHFLFGRNIRDECGNSGKSFTCC